MDDDRPVRRPVPSSARILLTVDESTYPGGTMGSVHPVTWTQIIGQGRSWYTALGHTPASYRDPISVATSSAGWSGPPAGEIGRVGWKEGGTRAKLGR